jgi:hypothetical protein
MARLSNEKQTTFIANMLLVHSVATCSNKVDVAGSICSACSACKKVSQDVTPTMKTFHGKLSEPIPDTSHIYGSKWYWDRVEKYGAVNAKWLADAQKAQTQIEETYSGYGVFKVRASVAPSNLTASPVVPTAKPTIKVTKARKPKETLRTPSTPTSIISYIQKPIYTEVEGPIETLPTDAYSLTRDIINGIDVFRCENGMVFRVVNNEPSTLLGFYKDSLFTKV